MSCKRLRDKSLAELCLNQLKTLRNDYSEPILGKRAFLKERRLELSGGALKNEATYLSLLKLRSKTKSWDFSPKHLLNLGVWLWLASIQCLPVRHSGEVLCLDEARSSQCAYDLLNHQEH